MPGPWAQCRDFPKRIMVKSAEVSSPQRAKVIPAAVLVLRKGDVRDLSASDAFGR